MYTMEQAAFQSLVIELLREQKDEIRDIKAQLREHDRMLREMLTSRDRVKVTWGFQWSLVSFVIAIVAAGLARITL